MARYILDIRSGCGAVIDTQIERVRNGLEYRDECVVMYARGRRSKETCPCCGHEKDGAWDMPAETCAELGRWCDLFNAGLVRRSREAMCVCGEPMCCQVDENLVPIGDWVCKCGETRKQT